MLKYDPSQRVSASDAMRHGFFADLVSGAAENSLSLSLNSESPLAI